MSASEWALVNEELIDAKTLVRRLVAAMTLWGSWEDGVPDKDAGGEMGTVGKAYDDAVKAMNDWSEP